MVLERNNKMDIDNELLEIKNRYYDADLIPSLGQVKRDVIFLIGLIYGQKEIINNKDETIRDLMNR